MRYIIITILIILSFVVGRYTNGLMTNTDADVAQVIIDENSMTLHYEFETEMSASVPQNPCNMCMEVCKQL